MSASGGDAPAPVDPNLAILGMIQIAVVLAVAVLITGNIFDAVPAATGPMANASTAVENQTGTAFELAPITLIVIVASIVIQIVRRV
jgi:hypothetical protein